MTQQGESFSETSREEFNTQARNSQIADEILQTVTQDLKHFHRGLVAQLAEEVTALQAQKARLTAEVEQLRLDYQALQARRLDTLSQQQVAQQQLWAKQLAQVLANHLQTLMIQRLNQIANENQVVSNFPSHLDATSAVQTNGSTESANRLLTSLDTTFDTTFKNLQQELSSYQSSLSQQLSRMQSLEQQGEVILAALVARLREQLQTATPENPAIADRPPQSNGYTLPLLNSPSPRASSRVSNSTPMAKPIPLEFPAAPLSLPQQKPETSQFRLGLWLVLLSTAALSLHNVVVRIIGNKSSILGLFQLGGVIRLSLGSSLLILWLRMLVVLPLMVLVAIALYPPVWRDMKNFLTAPDRRPLYNVVGSGAFLFFSQVFIYISIGEIGPGVAVTILFMYPILTVPLAWLLFRDRPTRLRWAVMATILLGVIFTAIPSISPTRVVSLLGVLAAIVSGIAFAFYLIFMQLGFRKLHPVPVSLIQFATIFLLSSILLIMPFDLGVQVNQPRGFIVGGILLGALTLVGYLANNFGVQYMGAARASIVASSGPVVTALLAFLLIQSPLQPVQWLGIVLVTAGVASLSFERMKGVLPGKTTEKQKSV